MSISHHSESHEEREARELLFKQILGDKSRQWPQGRISGEDDGVTAFAIATDPTHSVIIIRFAKPMDWIGLGVHEATQLRNKLDEKIAELSALKK